MTYKNCPGACGRTLVPGLATAPGTVSDNGLTWTYHLKSGVKFQDGRPVTSQDVKYAVYTGPEAGGGIPIGEVQCAGVGEGASSARRLRAGRRALRRSRTAAAPARGL